MLELLDEWKEDRERMLLMAKVNVIASENSRMDREKLQRATAEAKRKQASAGKRKPQPRSR